MVTTFIPELPRSLKRARRRRLLKKTILWLCCQAIIYTIVLLDFSNLAIIYGTPYIRSVVFFLLIFSSFTLFLFKIPRLVFDKQFVGTVTSVTIKESVDTSKHWIAWFNFRPLNNLVLSIRKDNGKTIEYTALSFELSSVPNKRPLDKFGKLENHIECFSIGDVVVKYRGFEHLVKICGSSSKTCICIQCGYHSSPANEYCIHCGKELINVKSIPQS